MSKLGAVGAGGVGWLTGLPPAVAVALVALVVVAGAVVRWLEVREQTVRVRIGWEGAVNVCRAGGDAGAVARALHQVAPAAPEQPPDPSPPEVSAAGRRGGLWRRS